MRAPVLALALALGIMLSLAVLAAGAAAHHDETLLRLGLKGQGLLPSSTDLRAPRGDLTPTASGAAAAAEVGEPPLRVYAVVVDGLRPQEVGPLTPTIDALRADGTWYEQARSVLPAETLPNHAAMLTGVEPGRNGIVANQIWRAASQKEYLQYPEFLDADTIVTQLERAYDSRGGISTATVLSKEYLFGLFRGEHEGEADPHPQREADFHWDPRTAFPLFVGDPSLHALDQATMDAFLGWIRQRRDAGDARPQFALVNLGDVDRAGHADEGGTPIAEADRAAHPELGGALSGEHVSPFRQSAIEATDTQLDLLVDELKQTGAWDETVIILLSDHGMDWGRPEQVVGVAGALTDAGYVQGEGPATSDFWPVGGGGSELIYVHHQPDIAPMARIISQVDGVDYVATSEPVPGLGNPTLKQLGLEHPYSPEIEVFLEPGWRSSPPGSSGNPLPGNHGHSVTQHSALLVAGGHPLLRDGPATVGGEGVWDPTRQRPYVPPAGGPGAMSVAPTAAALFGIGAPEGGFDSTPLSAAFDAGAFEPPGGGGGPGGGGPGGGELAPPGGPGSSLGTLTTTLSTDRITAGYGRRFKLSGRITADSSCGGPLRVTLYKLLTGAPERVIATSIHASADGSWSHRLSSSTNAAYRALVQPTERCHGSRSGAVTVNVQARIEVKRRCAGGIGRVSGSVLPRAPRTRVLLQRRVGRAWRRAAAARLGSGSRFRFRLPSCTGRYRVSWPTQGGRNVGGTAAFTMRGGR